MRRDEELEAFKTSINLSEYAAAQGYELDRKGTSRNEAVMRAGGDKISIGFDQTDGHWIYWSARDGNDAGSIIDFVQGREGGNLGQVRQTLRPWLPGGPSGARRPEPESFVAKLEPITQDLAAVRAKFQTFQIAEWHPYLEETRKIPAEIIASDRFKERVHIDGRGNAVFMHLNRDGVCGYELKNDSFTGFAPGGEKGLWCSRGRVGDTALVIVESAVNALSYAALQESQNCRFVSTGGGMNATQPDLIWSAMDKMPDGSQIVLAVDHDQGGGVLFEKIQAIFADLDRAGLALVDGRPPSTGEDWNDVLRASMGQASAPKLEP